MLYYVNYYYEIKNENKYEKFKKFHRVFSSSITYFIIIYFVAIIYICISCLYLHVYFLKLFILLLFLYYNVKNK